MREDVIKILKSSEVPLSEIEINEKMSNDVNLKDAQNTATTANEKNIEVAQKVMEETTTEGDRVADDGEGFDNPDNDPRGPWKADPFQVGGWRPNQQYEIVNPKTGVVYHPNPGCSWKNDYNKYQEI